VNTSSQYLKRAGPFAAVVASLALILVPSASSQGGPPYTDPAGDSATAGDITGVTVAADKASGQIIFRITGTNLSTSQNSVTMLNIDSDANPLTGDILSNGADYWFGVDNSTYDFAHFNGSDWVQTPYTTVRVSGGGSQVLISVNKSELGNPSEFNFSVDTLDVANKAWDHAPDDGMFNYSIAAGGPDIQSVDLQTTPTSGPVAGQKFVVTPVGLKLPPTGGFGLGGELKPESYTCAATLNGHPVKGAGTGSCTLSIPKKKSRRKQLSVTVTVSYEGASKSFTYPFQVH
jgi:hypothetical protein